MKNKKILSANPLLFIIALSIASLIVALVGVVFDEAMGPVWFGMMLEAGLIIIPLSYLIEREARQ